MITRNSYHQPTLTQMDFVQKPSAPTTRPIPSGWQRTVDQDTGDPFYVNGSTGRVVYKYDDMFRKLKKPPKHSVAVTPIARSVNSGFEKNIPDVAVSTIFFTPPAKTKMASSFEDGTQDNPIFLEADEVSTASEAVSDLSQSLPAKKKKAKIDFSHSQTTRDVVGETSTWHTDADDSTSNSVSSPGLSRNYLAD
jgi:hypothetical protein